MSVVFMIGNGFDINCGIKSRYQDVYDKYILEPSKNDTIIKFKQEINDKKIDNWGDFEIAMAKYAKVLSSEDELLECLRDFKRFLIRYLNEEQKKFLSYLESDSVNQTMLNKEMNNSIKTFHKGVTESVSNLIESLNPQRIATYSAISFNYTDAFDVLFSRVMSDARIVHIHGTIEPESMDVAIGMDNESQLNLPYPITSKGKRAFLKPIYNQEYNKQRVETAKRLIENASVICVFGMSLSESDYSWRDIIISKIDNDERVHVIIYVYEISMLKGLLADEKMDIEEVEKIKLLRKWGVPAEEKYINQIHIPCGRNIFNIKNVLQNPNLKK